MTTPSIALRRPSPGALWLAMLMLTAAVLLQSSPAAAVSPAESEIGAVELNSLPSNTKKRILVLNSYNVGYAWTDNEVRAIQDVFAEDQDVILHMEFMDSKVSNAPQHFSNLARLLELKFATIRFDIIIATDDDALDFLRQYSSTLFPDTPIVFAGINNFRLKKIAGLTQVTGVNEEADFNANLELIARLRPGAESIYVISDNLTAGRMIRREFDAAADDFRHRFDFHYLSDLTMEQLLSRVAALKEDSAIFYLTFFQDAAGRHFAPQEAIPLIAERASIPMFGQVDYMIGEGIVGGKVKSAYYQGRVAAQTAQRILNGELAECIPIEMQSPNYYMFDYEQLKRFGIGSSILPQGSIIVNQPETFFYKYRALIASVLAVFFVLISFILILLVNIRRRKRAQKGLQDILLAMASVLELDTATQIKEKLIAIINRIIFLERRIDQVAVYNYNGTFHDYDSTSLIPLTAESVTSQIVPDESLIQRAIEKGSSLVHANECVALFRTHGLSGNVVYMSGRRRFEDIDQDLLEILTSNVSMAIETLEKSKLQESLETARQIQFSMLPQAFAEVSGSFGLDVHAALLPAREVGGDLYDVFKIDDEHLCIAVGDVADKGVPAALFMAVAKTLIRAKAEPDVGPEVIINKVNAELVRDNEQCLFVTLFLAIFDRKDSTLRYVNAGHNLPYRIDRLGQPSVITGRSGPALGIIEDISYKAHELPLKPGEALFLYTDGITEAANTQGVLYGEDRLEQTLRSLRGATAKTVDDTLFEAVNSFAQGAGQADDMTVLTLRRMESP